MPSMSQITIDVPDVSLAGLHLSPEATATEVRVAAAIGLYAAERLTHFQACQLAGISRIEFSERLRLAHIPEHYRTADDLAMEFAGV
jgi:predicted HTH domain antitoxin